MFGAALPAGSYSGSLGRYAGRHEPSNQGARARETMKAQALGRVGFAGLGDVNLCTDPGWAAANAILGAAGGTITQMNTSSAGPDGTPDRGWGAVGAGTSSLATAWSATCAAQQQQQQTASAAAAAQQLAQQRAENEMAIARARAQFEMQQQAQASASGGVDTNTLLIGGAVLGAVVLGALFLKR